MSDLQILSSIKGLRSFFDQQRYQTLKVGFVPTMGNLHEGHASLLRRAADENDLVVLSIFVNPLQFGANEDFSTYPRSLNEDLEIAQANGATVAFCPTALEMYPDATDSGLEFLTTVNVAKLGELWEGASRPEHFKGVTTVVSKLFNIVGPCTAYFGEKDFQQLTIIRKMITDLSLPIQVVGCAIIRDSDGLALSSRNQYLDSKQRSAAIVLHRTLTTGLELFQAGQDDPHDISSAMLGVLAAEPQTKVDYAAVVDPLTLEPPLVVTSGHRLIVAAKFGSTRLIDNLEVTLEPPTKSNL
jgi:pantoate--beta-alanine ligase